MSGKQKLTLAGPIKVYTIGEDGEIEFRSSYWLNVRQHIKKPTKLTEPLRPRYAWPRLFNDVIHHSSEYENYSKILNCKTSKNAWNENGVVYSTVIIRKKKILSKYRKYLSNFVRKLFCVSFPKNSFLTLGIYSILLPLFSIVMSTSITLVPQHNVIENPEYWYEPIIIALLGYFVVATAKTQLECSILMKSNWILTWKTFFTLFLWALLGYCVPYVAIHLVWVYVAEYPHPMPFMGQICAMTSYVPSLLALWFRFPRQLRIEDRQYRSRLIAYLSLFPLNILLAVGYSQVSSLFFRVPTNLQWIISPFLPLVKIFNIWLRGKVVSKVAGDNSLSTKVVTICCVGSLHSFSIAVLLGSKVTLTAACLVMVLDCIPNVWACIKIVKLNKNETTDTRKNQNDALQCLCLKEFLELSIPVVYCASFVIAYFGPNADIIGNVQNDYWQFEKVENVFEKLSFNAMFFIIDSFRVAAFCFVLWRYCKLNMLKIHCNNISFYGMLILLYMTQFLNLVRLIVFYNLSFPGIEFVHFNCTTFNFAVLLGFNDIDSGGLHI